MATSEHSTTNPTASTCPETSHRIYTPRKWDKKSFTVFPPFDVLDAIYPLTPDHLKRVDVRTKTINSTQYTPSDQYYFPLQKGHVMYLARVAMILGFVTTEKPKYKIPYDKSPEFAHSAQLSEDFETLSVYSRPDFSLNDVMLLTYAHSGSKPVWKDIPQQAHSDNLVTPIDWMIKIASRMLQITLTPLQAHHILAEYWVLQRITRVLGSAVKGLFLSEEYCLEPQWTNHQLTPHTQKAFCEYQSASDRSLLHDIINKMASEDRLVANQEDMPEGKTDKGQSCEGISPSPADFKCTLPYSQFDALPRSTCQHCDDKIHLYCSQCLSWSCFSTQEEANDFFAKYSTIPDNPLLSLVSPSTPQHPKLLEQISRDGEPSTISYSQYSPFYTPTLPPPTQVEGITPEAIDDLVPRAGIALPLSIELIYHPGEKLQKSTGLHTILTSHQMARLVSFPDHIPDYDPTNTVILFPTDDAYTSDEIDWRLYNHCVVVEATWSGTTAVLTHPKLKNLKKVKLDNYQTLFWRNQQYGSAFLATIEAIYYLCREVHMSMIKQQCITPSTIRILDQMNKARHTDPNCTMEQMVTKYQYSGELDDLLFLFLLRLRRVLGTYHNTSSDQSINDCSSNTYGKKHTKLQPKTWTLGLGSTNTIHPTQPQMIPHKCDDNYQ